MRIIEINRLAAMLLIAALAVPAMAGPPVDTDAQDNATRLAYVPTEAAYRAYIDASDEVYAAAQKDPTLAAEGRRINDEPSVGTMVADWESNFRKYPHYAAYFTRHGLTARDTAIWMILLPYMMQEINQPKMVAGAHLLSPVQVQFALAHAVELKKLMGIYSKRSADN